jgi:hypothetical protein
VYDAGLQLLEDLDMSIIAQSVKAVLFVALLSLAAACSGGGGECTPGSKGCACTAKGACEQGLTCQANKCVEGVAPGTGGATTPATTTPRGTGGAKGTGGATGAGGATSVGGATGAGGATQADAGADARAERRPDAAPGDVLTPPDATAIDSTPPPPPTVKDPYFTTTEENDGMHAWYLPWADRSAGPTDMSGMNSSQEVVPLTIGTDGHLYRNGARYRLYGVNKFGDCSPSRETADLLAARMAKMGFNAIRHQGCDAFYGWPNSRNLIDYSPGHGDTLDPERLERFDYFLAALRKRGFYSELPLLSSRRFLPGDSGDPASPLPVPPLVASEAWGSNDSEMHKVLGFILDSVVAAQQRYARALLTHVNPHTGLALGKDPAIALVEIVNESGLIHYWMWQRLDQLDSRVLAELRRKWNAWLLAKHATTAALDTAWGATAAPTELLGNTSLATPLAPWTFHATAPAVATATTEANADGANPALRIDITAAGTEPWHVQLFQSGMTLVPGQAYRLSFRAKASSARDFIYEVSRHVDPWRQYTPWQATPPKLGTEWQDYTVSFVAPSDVSTAPDTRVLFGVGLGTGSVWIGKPSLGTGGPVLATGETLEAGTIPLVPRLGGRFFPRAALLDYIRFLRDIEISYFRRMTDFLRKDLGVTALVKGSQIMNSPPSVQAAMDLLDNHAYWGHPQFPNTPFDRNDWWIDNQSIVHTPPGLLDLLGSAQVAGKPIFATEATHAHPTEFAGEGPLLTGAYASLQDFDAFFQHEWGWQGQYDANEMRDWFDVNHHPPKLTSTALVARLFRSFDVAPAKQTVTVAMDPDKELAALFDKGREWRVADAATRGFPMAAAAISRVQMNVASGATDVAWPDVSTMTKFVSDTGELSWDKTAGLVTVNTAKARAVVGFAGEQAVSLGGPGIDCGLASGPCVTIKPGKTITGHSTIHLQLTEGESFATGAGRALLSATGTARNTDMQWNATKTGTTWGRAPTRVEVIAASVTLPRASSEVAVYALDGRGQRIAQIPVTGTSTAAFSIGGSVPTLWYEVVLGAAAAKGEGNKLLDACAAYCTAVTTSLPTCYPSQLVCLADCGRWAGDVLGNRCDCSAEVDALFACEKSNTTRICGRLSQGVPPSNACLPAFMQAFKCGGKVAPCTASLTEALVDDFEDGDLLPARSGFGAWNTDSDAGTALTPSPFASSAHGANGSARAAHLSAAPSASGYFHLNLPVAASAGLDLSGYAGIALSLKGQGRLRVGLPTVDMEAAGNYDAHGRTILLSPEWRRHVIRFDDVDFHQEGWGAKAPFSQNKVSALRFGNSEPAPLDFWVDDVVLLKAS